jgi:hypothetical protein
MQENYRDDAQRFLALPANSCFALKVLNEPVGEVIGSARTPGRLGSRLPAMGTREFQAVFLRVAVQGGPTCVA